MEYTNTRHRCNCLIRKKKMRCRDLETGIGVGQRMCNPVGTVGAKLLHIDSESWLRF